MKGMGAQVKKTVMSRNDFLPQMSDSAPIRGADRKDRKPWAEREHSISGPSVTGSRDSLDAFSGLEMPPSILTFTPWTKPFIRNVC